MVAVVEARQLSFPKPPPLSLSLSSPPHITSLLFDPTFLSLALYHSDSSVSLYPSFSPLSPPSPHFAFPPPQTLVPPPISSATFLVLRDATPNPNSLFVASSPLSGGSAVLLRFYILTPARKGFARARVVCNHSDLKSEASKFGVVFGVSHGVSVKLAGSVNVFAMYSISNAKVWVFSVKHLGHEEVKLMKCAVIDCSTPVFSMSLSFGFLILGEENGVRVLPLRPLVKGRAKNNKGTSQKNATNALEPDNKMDNKRQNLQNGMINGVDSKIFFSYRGKIVGSQSELKLPSNSHLNEKSDQHSESVKLRSIKLRQDSREWGASYIAFNHKVDNFESVKVPIRSVKAITIQALSSRKFLILDSVGKLHILCLANSAPSSEINGHMKQLNHTMSVQKMAVLPDNSTRVQAVWLSDGLHSMHVMAVTDIESSVSETENKETDERLLQTSVPQAIFSSETIQEIAPVTANSVMLLGQGSMFVYAIS
ncbi:PREDICTED: uncharacterized protein LOC109168504 [Ipomoea nil]|uniref:uncharacterized protein LOC109168504 n=1 Tax=Ipomoea nil TaxID=35883 RepID=UPI00090159A9|nr:PREDICTED: uncharacterized protein LOC109168504 [Ipomoea nil]XP_019173085.1 PREDICTED: uncharacterized protein LOC109168504 [Ipomoea nil]